MALVKRPDGSYPAPLPASEPARLAALHAYEILDTPQEKAFDDIAFLASHICGTPISLITLIDADRQWFKAHHGIDATGSSRDVAFCSHAILEPKELLEVPDATADERFDTNPFVVEEPKIRFYAGVPLVSPDGHALGTLCTLDRQPRHLDEAQRRALRALANEVTSQLELRRTIALLGREITSLKSILSPPPGVPLVNLEARVRSLVQRLAELQARFEPTSR